MLEGIPPGLEGIPPMLGGIPLKFKRGYTLKRGGISQCPCESAGFKDWSIFLRVTALRADISHTGRINL